MEERLGSLPKNTCLLMSGEYLEAAPPIDWGGNITLETVYSFDPVPAEVAAAQRSHILGVQGCVWTEFISTSARVEYMAFPRAMALAEVAWSRPAMRDWGDFQDRLRGQERMLTDLELNYRPLDS